MCPPWALPRPRFRNPSQVVFMKIGVAKETAPGERRVALVPEVLGKLEAAGLDILVEQGAGAGAAIP
ncbi:MAG: NAD(P)(+) transhydrogenase (Re/Si-specific) subunit alpha, partial [Candidatus Limnocylindrales bacterium]